MFGENGILQSKLSPFAIDVPDKPRSFFIVTAKRRAVFSTSISCKSLCADTGKVS